jgi:hypothetical protein
MACLETDVLTAADAASLPGMTFARFVQDARWLFYRRADALRRWVHWQPFGVRSVPFAGSEEERGVIGECMRGKRRCFAAAGEC